MYDGNFDQPTNELIDSRNEIVLNDMNNELSEEIDILSGEINGLINQRDIILKNGDAELYYELVKEKVDRLKDDVKILKKMKKKQEKIEKLEEKKAEILREIDKNKPREDRKKEKDSRKKRKH